MFSNLDLCPVIFKARRGGRNNLSQMVTQHFLEDLGSIKDTNKTEEKTKKTLHVEYRLCQKVDETSEEWATVAQERQAGTGLG